MVNFNQFVGIVVGTYVAVKSIDSLVIWMAENREEKIEHLKFERRVAQRKRDLIRDIKEREASRRSLTTHHDDNTVGKSSAKQFHDFRR